MKLPALRIGDLIASIPIVQGGMGIGISLSKLASAVANAGGIGTISGILLGHSEPDYKTNFVGANIRALRNEIKKARKLSPKGILAANFLVAMNHYDEIVGAAVDEGIDIVVSGAGLPTNLPALVKESRTRIAPIVSSGKAADVLSRLWDRNYGKTADMVIVEGPEAGGHLGFTEESLVRHENKKLVDLVRDVIRVLAPFREKYRKEIPVIAAGGIFTGKDIAEQLEAGASGVQMATRFVATEECDAAPEFKQAYLDAKQEDIVILRSPVGMPGRALNNRFIKETTAKQEVITRCNQCIRGCNPKSAPYCISKALVRSMEGNVKDGLVFVGSNAHRVTRIETVRNLINHLVQEAEEVFQGRPAAVLT
ncbi:MAG TPA: nitronate monooxygenase [Clostridiales bacterium]|nr:nitronate monooxygenase [Clostridiales bacterium]